MSRIAGLDLGTKTLGIAISDPTNLIATGIETIHFKENHFNQALDRLEEIIKKYDVNSIVIGLPRHMNGDIGEAGQRVLAFKSKIEERFKIKVETSDERWTSIIANKVLLEADLSRKKRKQIIDKMAAREILQNYLDQLKNREEL
jgi:putative Holliday junction resolvase